VLDQVKSKAAGEAKLKPVTVESKLRKLAAHSWFEAAAQGVKAAAIQKKREEKQKEGPKLSAENLVAVADELEEVQRQLNPLLTKKEELSAQILAHWGYTGVEEIESTLGKTRITASMSLGVDQERLEQNVSEPQWRAMTRRVLQAPLMLALTMKKQELRPIISKAITATNVKVAVVPPSSRTAKTGDGQDEEG
jgi:hypothetical protein